VKNAIVTAVALNQMGDLYKQTQWFGLQTTELSALAICGTKPLLK
jgi:hypothetical protein